MVRLKIPAQSKLTPSPSPAILSHSCVECGRIVEKYCNPYELCQDCWLEPFTHHRAIHAEAPIDPNPCPFAAGSPEKIEWMAQRLSRGYSIFSPNDPTYNSFDPGVIQPANDKAEVCTLPKLRIRGVMKHRLLRKEYIEITYRARPEIDGKRYNLGSFPTYEQAAAVVKRWWIQRIGLFWEFGGKMWWHLRKEKPRPVKKKKCEICAYHARFRNRVLGLRRRMPLKDGGLFASISSTPTTS
jgi:hypothetical protein